jgi:alkylation response protein AidB-like acyl-CoA dehydrogenase
MTDLPSSLEKIASEITAKHAVEVDEGAFPTNTIDSLRDAGLLGFTTAKEFGGLGQGLRGAAGIVERLARECASSAMVMCMHYSGVAVLEQYGSDEIRRSVANGQHLSTLAFSESGSRSHFWAPLGTARADPEGIRLEAHKSWVTSASHATAYIWSSQPISAEGASSIWLVPADVAGLRRKGPFKAMGMRGNDSTPVIADSVLVGEDAMLGEDGQGFEIMMGTVLPNFQVMNSACSIGLMEGAIRRTCDHVTGTHYAHIESSLADLPTIRNYIARMRVQADASKSLWLDTMTAIEDGREDAMLRVLQCKAAAGEAATSVLDLAMRVCGGAAFRQDVGVDRYFRDTRAATVMAPTTDALYDFIGKACCGMELF